MSEKSFAEAAEAIDRERECLLDQLHALKLGTTTDGSVGTSMVMPGWQFFAVSVPLTHTSTGGAPNSVDHRQLRIACCSVRRHCGGHGRCENSGSHPPAPRREPSFVFSVAVKGVERAPVDVFAVFRMQ